MKQRGEDPTGWSRRSTAGRPGTLALAALLVCAACGDPGPRIPERGPEPASFPGLAPIPDTQWVRLVLDLSEPGGYFDTDNLISNETSYLHVLGPMDRLGVRGGAYVGVGPDQSFSYVARQRPELAFILDIRRDNLLHHLLLKALFHEAERRVDFLALLFGRSVPEPPVSGPGEGAAGRRDTGSRQGADPWLGATPEAILTALGEAPGGPGSDEARGAWSRLRARVLSFGIPLAPEELATVERFHGAFVAQGGDLRFTSHGRAPRPYYPTFGRLLTETDLDGRPGSYLATEEAFGFVDALQEANRVVPVVGDLAGPSALRGIGSEVAARGLTIRVLYTSNVEYYLMRSGTFPRFAASLAALPVDRWSVLVRSVFPTAARHPDAVPGYYSTQTLVRLEDVRRALVDGGYSGYGDLVTRDALPLVAGSAAEGSGRDRPGSSPGPGGPEPP